MKNYVFLPIISKKKIKNKIKKNQNHHNESPK